MCHEKCNVGLQFLALLELPRMLFPRTILSPHNPAFNCSGIWHPSKNVDFLKLPMSIKNDRDSMSIPNTPMIATLDFKFSRPKFLASMQVSWCLMLPIPIDIIA
ncbi:hypothetical protein Goari_008722 [Gossypium aridum]|uniref:Uncharacterized protein n=1 Tax=Gossypium aridum TaxID=34290 RepID=A0A7J8XW70_GOSAI|nr:hypothetical protein [Gossypium aridum]